jgi:hypothetical protein
VGLPQTLDPMARWRDLVGGFILAFGDIELVSFRLWREHVRVEPIPHNFKERTGRVLGELRRLSVPPIGAIVALEKALKLADKRNTIAHHPMQVQVFQHSSNGELFFDHAISSETHDDYIDDLELMELRAEVETLVRDLYVALGHLLPEPRSPNNSLERSRER